ncbi:autotransporter outer membrane beta-barrel domain-containing protein [Escherichia coli]|uniref:Autotransporter outer membrane beta-barrel domain-containing protein n=5 Tax=Enterobacteriaceae TaxID=543 RepID=A0A751F3H5_SALER|nr:outer membrane autotransporter barrel domain protein [Escherichia coli ECC-1470]EAC1836998.1 autotransporter outer membrane beta-barrel domain-containing protein [Escherichia coli]HAF6707112.1 autotransporter outer membrane beta-barrel domain-containing protein [Salmonella enterica]EEV6947775.1 autotransporter outer membrane beta-barrel domain-containing protein [Escherichia coli]EEV7664343.1 autotransporter outer membrane beta-barrel domain-containing protein [Escherichia coli]
MNCQRYFCFVNGIVEIRTAPEEYQNKPVLVGSQSDGLLIIDNHADIEDGIFSTLHIGNGYNGAVDVINGAALHMDNRSGSAPLIVGAFGNDIAGKLNISGRNSIVSYRDTPSSSGHNESIYVGFGPGATGWINIFNGGVFEVLNSTNIYVGSDTPGGGDGSIVIDGSNSKMTADFSEAYVGLYGNGDISLKNGGQLSASNLYIGGNGRAIVNISGTDSRLIANMITISGSSGAPGIYIADQGILNVDNYINITTANDTKGKLFINSDMPGTIESKGILFGVGKAELIFKHNSDNYAFSSPLISKNTGNGIINAESGETHLTGDNTDYSGLLNILPTASIDISSQKNIGKSVIVNNGVLQITSQDDWTFNNNMTGNGYLNVHTGGHNFAFQNSTNTQEFTGTLALSDTLFDLSDDNTTALTSALVLAGVGSVITAGTGTQVINGFSFDGGAVNFGAVTQGAQQTESQIQVTDNLYINGNGAVRVSTPTDVNGIPQVINSSLSLLEQDDSNATIKLVDASSAVVKGNGGNLQLQDASGQVISSGKQRNIVQQGKNVAKGVYDYRLTSGPHNDGLYIGYALTQLDLLASGVDALVLDAAGTTGNAADMSARITGAGDLAFNSQKGETVSLSNQDNDYTGVTAIRGGNVLMNSNSVLGQTSEIRLATDTRLDMNGHSQTVGKLNGAAGSVLNINGGNLTLTDDGVSAGTLTGGGFLNISGGVLDITGGNHTFAVSTIIAKDATVRMNDVSGLGTGNISNAGTLSLTHASGLLSNNLSGSGTVSLINSDTQISGNNSNYSGLFVVDTSSQLTATGAQNLGIASVNNRGILQLNNTTDWQLINNVTGTGNVRKTGSGSLTVRSNAAWSGQTDIDDGSLILGQSDAPVMLASSLVNIAKNGKLTGFGGVVGNVTNSGSLDLRSAAPGNILTIGGNYTGNNGTLLINTVLDDSSSATDKLVIKGDASGKTRVAVTNVGGSGANTLNSIEVIHVDGNAANAEFIQAGRIAAGAYDYTLGRGPGSNYGNWYLSSSKNTPEPRPDPEPTPEGHDNNLRPEAGTYTTNLVAANTMFVTRLHERLGQTQYVDAITGEPKATSMWMRHEGGHNRWRDGSGQLKTQSNRYVIQLGGDIAQWDWGGTNRWHLGVMAGYGNNHSSTGAVRTGYHSKGSVNGYSTGLYATWYADDETHNGAYLDTWAQYGWFDNHVKGDGLPGESWKSKGLTASLETGYAWKIGEFSSNYGNLNEWYVQPQAQLVWMGVKADELYESNGTLIESTGDGNVHTRLGVKTWIKRLNKMDDGKSREFSPFVEVNWLHNTRDFGVRMNGEPVYQDGTRNIGEVKTGVEGQINPHLNLWGNVRVQVGDKGYNDTSAMLGVKYTF